MFLLSFFAIYFAMISIDKKINLLLSFESLMLILIYFFLVFMSGLNLLGCIMVFLSVFLVLSSVLGASCLVSSSRKGSFFLPIFLSF